MSSSTDLKAPVLPIGSEFVSKPVYLNLALGYQHMLHVEPKDGWPLVDYVFNTVDQYGIENSMLYTHTHKDIAADIYYTHNGLVCYERSLRMLDGSIDFSGTQYITYEQALYLADVLLVGYFVCK